MNRSIRTPGLALACVLALGSAVASAQPADGERAQKMQAALQKRFAAADTNGDGRLTKEEASSKMPTVSRHFDEIDSARSGTVTLADIAAFARAQRDARKSAP